jgi:hypothetical protein
MNKSLRSRLIGGFGAAGGTLVGSPILQMLIGLEWPLWPLVTFESLGVLFIVIAIVLHVTDEKKKKKE